HASLKAMNHRQRHRGPDDEGYYLSPDHQLGFGFRRLAIIDLSPNGHQPMTNEDESLWIVFNGEVYNYPELRRELVNAGHEFRSTSDTETVLHGYEEWGVDVVKRLSGMFAFAIWNQNNHTIFMARDRLGIKPLHYYWDEKKFAFASEIKSLLTLRLNTDLDHSAIWDYFTYLYVPTPKTIYKHIRKLPPAHYAIFNGDLKINEYWDVKNWGTSPLSKGDAADAVRDQLFKSTSSHLIADVPVGVLLSGGLDSSAVTAAASSQSPISNLQSFSIGFDIEEHSELKYAQIVADTFHTTHRTRIVSRQDFSSALDQMIDLYDEPFADGSGLPTLAVSRLAAEHVKVVVAGDGGDETLAGYIRYLKWVEMAQRESGAPSFRDLLYEKILLKALTPFTGVPKVLGLISAGDLDLRGKRGADRYGALIDSVKAFQKPKLLPDLAREFKDYDDYWYVRKFWRDDLDEISAMQYVDIKTYLHDDILTKVDRASMAASLEVRVPLLDHAWVELAASLPAEWRFQKSIFREALIGVLPESILNRSKKGFSAPLLNWQEAQTINGARLGGSALWAWQVYETWRQHRLPKF
ncbi:MAG: asparagine synthase (glutamine-hydrolyzing), partial [Chloroflexi bacterium]|nr:asparagine synthase (glutamine-hydrolyzing) [Chloroflexota bacterium]